MQTNTPSSAPFVRLTDRVRDPAHQAFLLLRTAFTVAPIAFGLDKFVNLLTTGPAISRRSWTG